MDYGRCRILTDWPDWNCEIHADDAQIQRQGKALTYPFTFKIDKDNKTASFSSSTDLPYYQTTLSSCTCGDFETRHLPCKHIYRLAVELGIIEIIKRSTKRKVSTKSSCNTDVLAEIYASDDMDSHPEQQKRIKSAKSAKTTPTSIDRETKTGIFPGSGKEPYKTTLHSCTCRDYVLRHLPCKHIYRLRMELGLLDEKAETGINKNDLEALQISLKDALKIIESYPEELQLIIKDILLVITVRNETRAMIELDSLTLSLLDCHLFTSSPTPSKTVLSLYRKKDIVEFLNANNIEYPEKLNKQNLISWCVDNIPNICDCHPTYFDFTCAEMFQKASRKSYTYLRRKFDWQHCDIFIENKIEFCKVPAGAKYFDNGRFYFPDDDVTKLLTEYKCNRCLNGFIIENEETYRHNNHNPKDYLYTKWGVYEMPNPYTIKADYGPRTDAKRIL